MEQDEVIDIPGLADAWPVVLPVGTISMPRILTPIASRVSSIKYIPLVMPRLEILPKGAVLAYGR